MLKALHAAAEAGVASTEGGIRPAPVPSTVHPVVHPVAHRPGTSRRGRGADGAGQGQQLLFAPTSTPQPPGDLPSASGTGETRMPTHVEGPPPIDPAAELWVRRTLADVLLRAKDPTSAGPQLTWLLERAPEDPRVLLLAAERHRLQGRPAQALPLLQAALEHQDLPFVRVRLVDVLIQLERLVEAEACLEGALALAPDDPYLQRRKARLLALTGRTDQAARTFARLASSGADQAPQDYVESLKLKLEALPLPERLEEVRRLLTVPSRRENPWLLTLAAELALACDRNEEAQTALHAAKALAPSDPFFLKRLGFAYNRLKCYSDVVDTLGAAFLQDPRELVVQQVLFAAARKAGRLSELHTTLCLAYERHPSFHKLSGLIKKVDQLIEQERLAPPVAPEASKPAKTTAKRRKGASS